MSEVYEEEYYDDEEGEDYNEEQVEDAEYQYSEEGGDEDGDIQVGEEIDLVRLFVPGVNSLIYMAKGHGALCYCRVKLLMDLLFPFFLQLRHTKKSGTIVL